MSPSLSQSPATFTREGIRKILEDVPYKLPIRIKQYAGTSWTPSPERHDEPIPYTIWTTEHEYDEHNTLVTYNAVDRRKRAWKLCEQYCNALQDTSDHMTRLDTLFSEVLEFNFKPPDEEEMDSIVEATCRLLERLPAVPPMLGIVTPPASDMEAGFFVEGYSQSWENLMAVRYVDSNVIRIAMLIVIETKKVSHSWSRKIVEYINLVGELFTTATEHTPASSLQNTKLTILRQFLWTGWQRVVLLNLYFALGSVVQAANISDRDRSMVLGVQLSGPLREALQSEPISSSSGKKSSYMCSWAFELLRNDRAALVQDFRAFHKRYNAIFGHLPPRCISDSRSLMMNSPPTQCKGKSPTQCKRFIGMKIQDQSAHAPPCQGSCGRLFWDEDSYRSVSGSRAVSIAHSSGSIIRYCNASYTTMSVSHVWSHGQGGRPEPPEEGGTGFNACLHGRYSRIAKSLGCDSYWMDTPCIPQDHNLRHEAIMEINNVFAKSQLTLVCDRDIMEIDVSDLTLQRKESLLSALLVCDWNVRAWTYLESVKGRENIYLLCKHDAILRLEDILGAVYQRGDITITVLFLTAQHLLPPFRHSDDVGKSKADMKYSTTHKEAMDVEDAASHLSHRHASRAGDEVVIWSLLTRSTAITDNALHFWQSRVGTFVPTGFLISSSPRLGYKKPENTGFGWAPRRPDRPERRRWWQGPGGSDASFHFAFDGAGSEYAFVTEKGLTGEWVSHLFDAHPPWHELLREWCGRGCSAPFRELRSVASRIPRGYYWGALLAPPDVENSTSVVPMPYRGRVDGTLLAVVASNGNEDGVMVRYRGRHENPPTWHWIGIVEWSKEIPLPELSRWEFLIV